MRDAIAKAGPPPPAEVPASKAPDMRSLTGLAVAVVVVAGLFLGREVLIPITLAMLLSFVLSPLVELLRRLRLGRVPSVLLAVVVALGIILALGSIIGTQVAQLATNAPQYQSTVATKLANVRTATLGRLSGIVASVGRQLAPPAGGPPAAGAPDADAQPPAGDKPIPVEIHQPMPSALAIAETMVAPILGPFATAGIILIVTIFTLLQKEDLRDRAIRLFGSSDLQRTTVAMNDAGRRLSRYFLTQLGINASFGFIVAVGLYFIGVPSPILWGILGTLLRFIPYIGSWIAAALPILLAAAVDPGWSIVLWTAGLYVATELVMGQVVEPLVYGHSTGLSPLAVVVAAIFWTWLWGPIGLIMSTPLTLCLVVLGRYIEPLEFLDVLLGDRPALTPVESFYQRMLAGDPDEAEEQAERYLADRPLSAYYDDVALKGLQLAANDMLNERLAPPRVERIKDAVNDLVRDLGKYADATPAGRKDGRIAGPTADRQALPTRAPGWRGATPVLCIAGRGPLDEAASSMLAQLLEKHGLGARVVPHAAASRAGIASLDVEGVQMLCVSYLDISGNPAHLRYLLRRLRERLPQARILVGLWPAQDPILKDQDLRHAMGADDYVATLSEAVEACLEAAANAATAAPSGARKAG